MHLKRFEAPTLEAALNQVKQDLGPDALILSSRTIKRGRSGFGLLSRSVVEVQAAIERPSERRAEEGADAREGRDRSEASDRPSISSLRDGSVRSAWAQSEFEEEIRGELRGLRNAVDRLLAARGGEGSSSEAVVRFGQMGLAPVHCQSLAAEMREQKLSGEEVLPEVLLRKRLEEKLTPPRPEDGERIRVLVGAPGVGKTTTLAKLAARNEEGEREVALISLDQYRVGGSEQLRRYAELLESPFAEIARLEEVGPWADRLAGHSLLIDTAGRGRRGEDRMVSLLPLRDRLGERMRVEVVLDATAREEIHQEQLARFAPLRPERLIMTKADECDSWAAVANLALSPEAPPLCWMGTGQRVPEDLEMVSADDIISNLANRAA